MDRRTFLQTTGLAGATSLAGCSSRLSQRATTTATPSGSWRQATGDAGNTAQAPSVSLDGLSWSVDVGDTHVTPPVVDDGVAVVGTAAGTVLAVDVESGEQRWQRETAGVQGTPAIVDGQVVVPADDGHLHRFALVDGGGPAPLDVSTALLSPVTAAGGRAFLTVSPGQLVAVDVTDWQVEWSLELAGRGVGKPAVDGDIVVVSGGSPNGTGFVRAVTTDGDARWQVQATKGLLQTPIATDNSVVGASEHGTRLSSWSADSNWTPSGVFWFDAAGNLDRVRPLHAPIWQHCDARFISLTESGTMVSGCNSLLQYGPDGEPTWSESIPQGVTTRPLSTPDGFLVGDAHGQFWLVDGSGRNRVFSVEGIPSTPAVLDRGVVVAAGGTLFAFA